MKCIICRWPLISAIEESRKMCTECRSDIRKHFQRDVHKYSRKGFAERIAKKRMSDTVADDEGIERKQAKVRNVQYFTLRWWKIIEHFEPKARGEEIANELMSL